MNVGLRNRCIVWRQILKQEADIRCLRIAMLFMCAPLTAFATTSPIENTNAAPTVAVLTPGRPADLRVLTTFDTEIISLGTASAFDRQQSRALNEQAIRHGFDPAAMLSSHVLAALHANGIVAVEIPFKRDPKRAADRISRADWPTEWPPTIERVLDISISVMGLRPTRGRDPVVLVRWRVRDREGRPKQMLKLVSYNARGADIDSSSLFSAVDIPRAPTELEPAESCSVPKLRDPREYAPQLWPCFDTALKAIAVAIASDPLWRAPVSSDSF